MKWLMFAMMLSCGCEKVADFSRFQFAAGNDMGQHDMQDPPDLRMADMSHPLDMTAPRDLTPPIDLTPPPDLMPEVPHYRPDIQKDIESLGCATAACHQSYGPLIMTGPSTDAQWMQNFTNFTMNPLDATYSISLVLSKNLAGNGVPHAGSNNVKPFATTSDPTYKKWAYWIQYGYRY
jgi:hypothetical protein